MLCSSHLCLPKLVVQHILIPAGSTHPHTAPAVLLPPRLEEPGISADCCSSNSCVALSSTRRRVLPG